MIIPVSDFLGEDSVKSWAINVDACGESTTVELTVKRSGNGIHDVMSYSPHYEQTVKVSSIKEDGLRDAVEHVMKKVQGRIERAMIGAWVVYGPANSGTETEKLIREKMIEIANGGE